MRKIIATIFVSLMWCSISIAETKYYPNGDEYIGELKNGKRDGQGTLKYSPWKQYVGEWKDDKRHGQGTLIDEGMKVYSYIGDWKEDKKSGLGLITHENGLKYKGGWKDDKENGKGTLILPNGKSYVGEFKDSKGVFGGGEPLVYEDGHIFFGKYKDGKKNGQGTLILSDGEKYLGTWEDGKLIEIDPTETVYVGVGIEEITSEIAEDKKLNNTKGALINNVSRNSPADKAGLLTRDIILKFDGKKIVKPEDLRKIISNSQPNKTVELEIWRDEKQMTGKITLAILESLGSPYASVLLQKGHALSRISDFDGAIFFYEKALEADPEYSPAQSSLEDLLKDKTIAKIVKSLDPVCQNNSDDFDIIKSCLEKHFFYKKNPIHPGILNTLSTSLADSGDIIIAINLTNAVGSNEYCCEEFTTELNDGKASVRIDYPDGNGFYIYSYLGATDNGAMVIKTWSNGGGSGVFTNLLIVKVKKRFGASFDLFNSEGVTFDKQQIVLEKLLSVSLGDRTETNISINGNSVTINDKTINIPSH